MAKASYYNSISDYLQTANEEICLLVQVENRAGLAALDEIASTSGVDGVFVGPADLAADMGYLGKPGHPELRPLSKMRFGVFGATARQPAS